MNVDHEAEGRGLRLGRCNTVLKILSCVLFVFLLGATVAISKRYDELLTSIRLYINLESKAKIITAASDYLTEQARLYVETGEMAHARLYMVEARVSRRRELVLNELHEYCQDSDHRDLCLAVETSQMLMQREYHAMKISAAARGHSPPELPFEIHSFPLPPEGLPSSPADALEKARRLLFDDDYLRGKNRIRDFIHQFTDTLLDGLQKDMMDSMKEVRQVLLLNRILLICLFTLNLAMFAVISFLVVRTLRRYITNVRERTPWEVSGVHELQYLGRVYNEAYQKNIDSAVKEALLMHDAEHDPLTGLLNRRGFARIPLLIGTRESRNLAMLLIDVDHFKQINDTHGHQIGDEILKKIAATLEKRFRAHDFLIRIGGDEFCVIMTDVTPEQQELIRNKMEKSNAELLAPEDGLPPVSLSVGVAFSDCGYHDELYTRADAALYWVKEHGRAACHFHQV